MAHQQSKDENKMTNNNKYRYNLQAFTNEDDISYYLLGAFITDGNVSYQKSSTPNKTYYSCEIKSADYEWIERISKICGENLKLTKASNSLCLRLRIHNTAIGEWLVNHDCIPNKTLCVKFPNIPDQYLADFIRGCWDGDGSVSLKKKSNYSSIISFQLNSASKDFVYAMQNVLLSRYNIESHIYKCKMCDHKMANGTIITARNQLYVLTVIGANNCKLFAENIYYENNRLSLNRKNEKAKAITAYYKNKPDVNAVYRSMDLTKIVVWPLNNDLLDMVNKSNAAQVAKQLGIDQTTMYGRIKKIKEGKI